MVNIVVSSDLKMAAGIVLLYGLGAILAWVAMLLIAVYNIDLFRKITKSVDFMFIVLFWPIPLVIGLLYLIVNLVCLILYPIFAFFTFVTLVMIKRGERRNAIYEEANYKKNHPCG